MQQLQIILTFFFYLLGCDCNILCYENSKYHEFLCSLNLLSVHRSGHLSRSDITITMMETGQSQNSLVLIAWSENVLLSQDRLLKILHFRTIMQQNIILQNLFVLFSAFFLDTILNSTFIFSHFFVDNSLYIFICFI